MAYELKDVPKQPNLEKAFTDDCYFFFNLTVVSASFYLDDAVLTVRSPDGLSSFSISRLTPLSSSDTAAFEIHRLEVAADPSITLVIPERACDPNFFLNLSVFIQAQVFDGILLNILRSCARNHSQREILPFSSGHQAILHLIKHFTRDASTAQASLRSKYTGLLKLLKSSSGDVSTTITSLNRNMPLTNDLLVSQL